MGSSRNLLHAPTFLAGGAFELEYTMATRAKKSSDLPYDVGDWVNVLCKVTRISQDAGGDIEHATVQLPNGNLATLRHNPDEITKAE